MDDIKENQILTLLESRPEFSIVNDLGCINQEDILRRASQLTNDYAQGTPILLPVGRSAADAQEILALLASHCVPILVNKNLDSTKIRSLAEVYSSLNSPADCPSSLESGVSKGFADNHAATKLVLLTSGSTGQPSGVRLSASNLMANAQQIVRGLEMSPSTRPSLTLPLSYTFGLSVLLSALASGGSVVADEGELLDRNYFTDLMEFGANAFAGVPFTYEVIKKRDFDISSSSLYDFWQAGGAIDDATNQWLRTKTETTGRRFWKMYGQTEATARISILHPSDANDHPASVGKLVMGMDFVNAPVWPTENEIVVSGPNVSLGNSACYKDLQAGDLNRGVLETGDIGYVNDEFLYLTGRKKRIVKHAGVRLNLDDLERSLRQKTLNSEIAVGNFDDSDRLVIFCPQSCTQIAHEILRHDLHLRPRSFLILVVRRLPRLNNGKVDYASLMELSKS